MNFLILLAILSMVALVILPFVYLAMETPTTKPGVSHQVLAPGHRRYTIAVPEDYTGEHPVPLILALHFAGHGLPYYGEMMLKGLIEPALRELGAVIVAPDCPAENWTQPSSEQFIFELLDDLQARFNIDSSRILITGYSLGGMGTWHFAGRSPERFGAAVIMAARPPQDYLTIDWQIPLLVVHGRKDELFPVQATLEAVTLLEKQGVDIQLRILENVSHYETQYFVGALRNAIPWIQEAWMKSSKQ